MVNYEVMPLFFISFPEFPDNSGIRTNDAFLQFGHKCGNEIIPLRSRTTSRNCGSAQITFFF